MLRPHIVIIGAGFGGTYTAKRLAPYVKKGIIDVTVVNKTNYFLFTPLLHEVATGSLGPLSVAEPLRDIFAGTGIEVCQGSAQSIDTENRRVHIANNGNRHTLPYDYLIISTGAETNYYGIAGAERYTFPLKNLADAARIRSQVIDCFEEAIMTENPEERARLLSFVVVGGGPTGVETVAELSEFVRGITSRYYSKSDPQVDICSLKDIKINLIHAGPELLQQFPAPLRIATENRLKKNCVTLNVGSTVTSITSQGINFTKGDQQNISTEHISSATIIWAAGVKPIIPDFEHDTPSLLGGRLIVDEFFHLIKGSRINPQVAPASDERVFVLGDVAAYTENGKSPLPMLAQVAVRQAKVVADNIIASIKEKPLKKFSFKMKGSLVSVGQLFAVGQILSKSYSGSLVWFLWRTIYYFKFASWKKRARISFDWTIQIFSSRDITKLT